MGSRTGSIVLVLLCRWKLLDLLRSRRTRGGALVLLGLLAFELWIAWLSGSFRGSSPSVFEPLRRLFSSLVSLCSLFVAVGLASGWLRRGVRSGTLIALALQPVRRHELFFSEYLAYSVLFASVPVVLGVLLGVASEVSGGPSGEIWTSLALNVLGGLNLIAAGMVLGSWFTHAAAGGLLVLVTVLETATTFFARNAFGWKRAVLLYVCPVLGDSPILPSASSPFAFAVASLYQGCSIGLLLLLAKWRFDRVALIESRD